MKKTYLVANWKSNKQTPEALSWIEAIKDGLPDLSPKLKVVICSAFTHLHLLKDKLPQFTRGVQDLSPYPDGAYTGEVSARMLQGLASFALLGHSERRRHFHETDQTVALKVTQAQEYNLTPIIAVSSKTWRSQLNQLTSNQLSKLLIMYEPPEAISEQSGPIGQGEAAPLKEVISAVKTIKKSAPQTPVLYGGSVKSHNLAHFLKSKIIDGVVVGSASLNAKEWLKILTISQESRG